MTDYIDVLDRKGTIVLHDSLRQSFAARWAMLGDSGDILRIPIIWLDQEVSITSARPIMLPISLSTLHLWEFTKV